MALWLATNMPSSHSRDHSEEITPPPPVRGNVIPRTGDPLRYPLSCDVRFGSGLSKSPIVKIYVFHQPDLWWETSGPVVDGLYSPLADHSLRNEIMWPFVAFTIYDVEQMRWVDIPTFTRIEVRPDEFLMFRAKSSLNIDSEKFSSMNSLILQLHNQYKPPIAENADNIPAVAAAPPVTPIRKKSEENFATPELRRSKRKHSESDTATTFSSPGPVTRTSGKTSFAYQGKNVWFRRNK